MFWKLIGYGSCKNDPEKIKRVTSQDYDKLMKKASRDTLELREEKEIEK